MSSRSTVRVTRSPTWSEGSHPRWPAGNKRGGQFAPKKAVGAPTSHHADAWAERTAKYVTLSYKGKKGNTASIHQFEHQVFGRGLSPVDYVHLTGALRNSHIAVTSLSGGRLSINVTHRDYEMTVIVRKSRTLSIDWLVLTDYRQRGSGLGTRLCARQVAGAQRMGIKKISLLAAGDAHESQRHPDASLNGWYTWARLGYNARLPGDVAGLLKQVPSGSPLHRLGQERSLTLHQLFDTPGGAEFWRQHGMGFEGTFDPKLGSPHYLRLEKTLFLKGIDPYAD